MVVAKQTTESLAALDLTILTSNFIIRFDDLVVEALVIPLSMIMFQKLADSGAKHLLAKEDHSFQRFFLYAPHEAFQMWIQIR